MITNYCTTSPETWITRIERVPGDQPSTSAFDVYVNGAVIGTCTTRREAQAALEDHLEQRSTPLPTRPLRGHELAALWHTDRDTALRFFAELSPGSLVVQALLHSQWLLKQRGTQIEPIEIVRRYQRAIATWLETPASAHQLPRKQAA